MKAPTFPEPGERYDARSEATFRQDVERTFIAVMQVLSGLPRVESVTLPAGDTHDYRIAPDVAVLRITGATGSVLTGITGGRSGRILRLVNVGSADLVLKHQSATSAEANRLLSATGDVTLGGDGAAELMYDATTQRWRVVSTLT